MKHRARVPGTVRKSRLEGGSGYRNHPKLGKRKKRVALVMQG